MIAAPAWAGTTYYVATDGDDDANGLTSGTAFLTIQKGITNANDGTAGEPNYATVHINSGTYNTGPIIIDNNYIRLLFEPNVEVLAKSNSDPTDPNLFLPSSTDLFEAKDKTGIIFDGNDTDLLTVGTD